MNLLQKCIYNFEKLLPLRYRFHIAHKRVVTEILLDFNKSDFKHLVGLQYLRDIAMPRNSSKVYDTIKNKKLTFDMIQRSPFFEKVDDSYASVKQRMTYFPLLNEFIESENVILRYIKKKNPYSKIDADYVIESTLYDVTVYIFLRKRHAQDINSPYAVVSFFVKNKVTYKGEVRYWLLKERIDEENYVKTLYQKEGYESKKIVDTNQFFW